jgi:hypothetical protein
MICERCHGAGVMPEGTSKYSEVLPPALPLPCDECGGSGVAHCCEGLRAQPEDAP